MTLLRARGGPEGERKGFRRRNGREKMNCGRGTLQVRFAGVIFKFFGGQENGQVRAGCVYQRDTVSSQG